MRCESFSAGKSKDVVMCDLARQVEIHAQLFKHTFIEQANKVMWPKTTRRVKRVFSDIKNNNNSTCTDVPYGNLEF